ncbi:alpha/beta fold hydrolase [Parahaliea mediterranea]|uniref:Alpha/beta fold hydrolase n=1 Tax=Parahaliea mediterranea TaxID=651086 RepID=A0A939DFG4_9GAMM|nr:alpha/beta hydrolase [Parahaliea mediterranea]MBN7796552.1 alpha/beta fold hydrolase [Parahaliea mediterranea]
MQGKAIMPDGGHIEYEVLGDSGPYIFMGPYFLMTPPAPELARLQQVYLESLTARYRIILANWPRGVGGSSPAKRSSMAWQQAVEDIHAIADAAGADTFAWWGYSFGAAIGIQLAAHSSRLSALVCGGFPPLWQPLSDMLSVSRKAAANPESVADTLPGVSAEWLQQGVAFYESVAGLDESACLRKIQCPCLVFHDVEDIFEGGGMKHDLSMRTRSAAADLKELGWDIAWVETGLGHMAPADPEQCLQAFSPFLDRVLRVND